MQDSGNTFLEKQVDPIIRSRDSKPKGAFPRIIAITSGKGGVGKTNITLNLAISLARLNKRVCVFDADLGLANINILLGVNPEFDIQHVISGEKEITDIIMHTPEGIQIIPGGSGIQQLSDINKGQLKQLIRSFEKLVKNLDYLFIDTSAGIATNVLSFVMAAQESIVVVTKEPTSLTDAYALIKVVSGMGHKKKINILVNMVNSPEFATKIFQKLFQVCKKHLNIELSYSGSVLMDLNITNAVCQQKPVLTLYPKTSSSKDFAALAYLINNKPTVRAETSEAVVSFWIRALKILKAPLRKPKPLISNKKPFDKSPGAERNNGVSEVVRKIAEMIVKNKFTTNDFLNFNEMDSSYIKNLDLFINEYYQFQEMRNLIGKDKFFIELDLDNRVNEE